MQSTKAFVAVFMVVGFVVKIASEIVHEVWGHGLFVLLFGGEITHLHISVLWPYDFSYIGYSLPSGINLAQMAWIYAGGILACLSLSFLTQAFLLVKKKIRWCFSLILFWLAFWTLVNSTGYLIIGGLTPFGDIRELVKLGVLTNFLSLAIGVIMFFVGFVILSWTLRRGLIDVFPPKKASLGVILFWLIIPVLVMVILANPEHGLPLVYFPSAFIPTLLSSVMEYFMVLSKQ